jgi:hypothetical protein
MTDEYEELSEIDGVVEHVLRRPSDLHFVLYNGRVHAVL